MGETGVGKTSLVDYLSKVIDADCMTMNINAGITDDEIISLYQDGKSMSFIGNMCNTSKQKIKRILLSNGIEIRSIKESCKYRPNPSEKTRKKMSFSHTGEKNHMKNKSLYESWLLKHGKEKADVLMIEYKKKMSASLKNSGFNRGDKHYSKKTQNTQYI